ncbi:chorismate mutase [Streptomyces sp. URMC 123]|uniref:chorismate mutase n=1 Tax=Streptomyces sp. URMC 123 TaxID=3423403 RepID=UPI003F1A6CC4
MDMSTATTTGTTAGTTTTTGTDTASGPGISSGPDTGARTPDAAARIASARRVVDDLDGRIIDLVRERMAVSEDIQRARMGSGGPRVSLSREMEILSQYREALGRPGTALAMTLLELCRGRV